MYMDTYVMYGHAITLRPVSYIILFRTGEHFSRITVLSKFAAAWDISLDSTQLRSLSMCGTTRRQDWFIHLRSFLDPSSLSKDEQILFRNWQNLFSTLMIFVECTNSSGWTTVLCLRRKENMLRASPGKLANFWIFSSPWLRKTRKRPE